MSALLPFVQNYYTLHRYYYVILSKIQRHCNKNDFRKLKWFPNGLTYFHRTSTDSVVGISTIPYAYGTVAITLTRSLRLRGFLINTTGQKVNSIAAQLLLVLSFIYDKNLFCEYLWGFFFYAVYT